ncbi:MAG: aminotransferase class V-fold PLP-dependent enzyme [Solirubrobacterales bacterium]
MDRDLFEIPDGVAYFNTASLAPQLRSVRAAGEAALDRRGAPWTISSGDWFTEVERLRGLFAEIVGADRDGIALVPATSYGLAVAANNLEAGPGQRVLVLDEEYPSGIYTWRAFVRRSGAELYTVQREAGQGWTDAILAALDERTAIVSVPNVHWTNGALIDLGPVGDRAREIGAAFVLDLSQSAGAMPIDVSGLRPDFLVAVGYKWLMGPLSLGYLYVDERHRDGEPLEHSWLVREGAENFARLVDYTDERKPGARRFDVGENSNFVLNPMAIAALEQILDWSVPRIEASLAEITASVEEAARARGLTALPADQRGPHMIGIELPESKREALVAELAARGVHAGLRSSWLRVAPHLHTTQADLDQLFAALDTVARDLAL